ncbi:MAG: type II toxin-antitoxin system HicA family toxin [Synergistaceae bacterium]|nr:type II toxin-antitoxin system HicA family toxin [Synergistaceae bacterium]
MSFLASMGYHRETGGKHGVKMVKDGNRVPIPAHKGNLPRGTAQHILEQAGYTVNDLMNWR